MPQACHGIRPYPPLRSSRPRRERVFTPSSQRTKSRSLSRVTRSMTPIPSQRNTSVTRTRVCQSTCRSIIFHTTTRHSRLTSTGAHTQTCFSPTGSTTVFTRKHRSTLTSLNQSYKTKDTLRCPFSFCKDNMPATILPQKLPPRQLLSRIRAKTCR